jgi:hypothetical protein
MRWPPPPSTLLLDLQLPYHVDPYLFHAHHTRTQAGPIPAPSPKDSTLLPFSHPSPPVALHLIPQFNLPFPHTFILAPINLYLPYLAPILRLRNASSFLIS